MPTGDSPEVAADGSTGHRGGRDRASPARYAWLMWWSCRLLLVGVGLRAVPGESEEHLVEAGVAECERGDLDTGLGQAGESERGAPGVVDPGRQSAVVGSGLDRGAKGAGQ